MAFPITSIVSVASGVKINMQGSVSLGKNVLASLSRYMRHADLSETFHLGGRRSGGNFVEGAENLKWTLESAKIGSGLSICNGTTGAIIKEYILVLATAIQQIFKGILNHNEVESKESPIFLEHLKPVLSDINEILKEADPKISKNAELVEWLTVVKKISARFQKSAIGFIEERLDGDLQNILYIKKKLIQKTVITLVLAENKYENRICQKLYVCDENYAVTTALNTLLTEFKWDENKRIMEFIKYFYENLPENLFYFLSMDTTHELQVILSDLSYINNAPTKDVLLSVQKTVEARWKLLKEDKELSKAYDQQLVNIILSDMDYFYRAPKKSYPFERFLMQFEAWQKGGGKFSQQMREVMKDISEKLQKQSPDLVEKMTCEIRVFLELTVDPEK